MFEELEPVLGTYHAYIILYGLSSGVVSSVSL